VNAEISETIRARLLGLGMHIPGLITQRKFVSAMCHAHSDAHTPPKPVAPTIFMLEKNVTEMYWSRQYLSKCVGLVNTYRLIQKKIATPTLTPTS